MYKNLQKFMQDNPKLSFAITAVIIIGLMSALWYFKP